MEGLDDGHGQQLLVGFGPTLLFIGLMVWLWRRAGAGGGLDIPRGHALGLTFRAPEADRYNYPSRYLRGRIVEARARRGRAAEEVVYADVTTRAESDLDQVSNLARQMVGRWGMSEAIDPRTVLPPPGQQSPLGIDGVAPATRELVDQEVRDIVEECHHEAVATLTEHREQLDALARTLLDRETLNEDEAYAAAGITRENAPAARARGEAPGTSRAPGMPPVAAAVPSDDHGSVRR
ncbi:hypothetical protein [Kutzneria buriramensis]|uniref:hypothetical protein n=1 Tax=Kutzneria buriramensis TaxID=1045776 RepID=UPI001B879FCB|nr:hypothetical protein [Kutzneria buriramensis]